MKFDDYKEELELALAQNCAVECELYSIIAGILRGSKSGIRVSFRDVSTRRASNASRRFKGDAGFPDFAVLERKMSSDAKILGCVEVKRPVHMLAEDGQIKGHIKTFGKVIFTNGLQWRFYSGNDPYSEITVGKYENGSIVWNGEGAWTELLHMIDDYKWEEKGGTAMKKIIAVNAGPRTGWNTDSLIKAAARGAGAAGAEVEYIDLFKLERYTGCVSCFGCKQAGSWGKCALHDGLHDVLEKIGKADGLIIGSPNYLGNLTASFRALYERLVFQSLTYNREKPNCNDHLIPVLLIMTSNCSEEMYDKTGYTALLEGYQRTLSSYVGPTQVFCCGNTLQVSDYGKFDWTMFDPEEKKRHHDETFEDYLARAEELGSRL